MRSIWFDLHSDSARPSGARLDGLKAQVVVAGAGLTGLATAVLLARSGQEVILLEDRRVGAVTTGHTTAKLSLLQGSVYSEILKRNSEEVLAAYLEGNREGQAWLTRYMDDRGIAYQRRDAWTFAMTQDGLKDLGAEFDACHAVGLDLQQPAETELPFPVEGALRLPDQVQIDPVAVLESLRTEFVEHGGRLFEGVRVTDATSSSPVEVTTTRGTVTAGRLVLATGSPILDRGGHFAKLVPQRSYVTTYRVPGAIPQGMYLSVDEPTRSLRTVPTPDGELLMVGGNGHITGRADYESLAVEDLVAWTTRYFPGAELTHSWSAQDYQPHDRLPFAGPLPRGGGAIYAATGFNKWGMANAIAAALNLSQQILGGSMEWADTLNNRPVQPRTMMTGIKETAGVAGELVKEWATAELKALPDEPPEEGDGVVGRDGVQPVGMSTVDGETCKVSGVCTHMGGVLRWNDAERSWDCPLHGSRFAADGTRLEGPAVEDLEKLG
ncbi:FAD-dependent oxidoreductase [Tessaracoccus flavus]|uniref:FAD-dependent oxidoreductase n=1 Tax=Tessaracoccus flavus TaxID=1610493 RepID=A0A1Q2CGX8_9ACTN|nr:FAD-dependent oxidoreductase [Tessaracoccus flavus]AQP45371.1 FAD-dependent oxidoreductase [Tessaracoccus flavus]SDY93820.1 Glycine/D-amino acid oxidase [Tessaracoccus flavus]